MEDSHLLTFEVSGFKKFTNLKIENIGQFNLIVGDNNVGKTSLLEALMIDRLKFVDRLGQIMFYIKKLTYFNSSIFGYYFSDQFTFPKQMRLEVFQKGGGSEHYEFNGIDSNKFTWKISFNSPIPNNTHTSTLNVNFTQAQDFDISIPFIPFGSVYTHELTKLYSKSVQKFVDKKRKLIESLSKIIPEISNIEVSVTDYSQPLLLISEKNRNLLSNLGSYGDGTIKFFRILLSLLTNDISERLMIDELDSGVHHSHQKDFIKSLLLVAKEQKKQIFATTHSKECIEYFTAALKETGFQQEGRIIKLAETKSGIKAYTNTFEQFDNALKADSELR